MSRFQTISGMSSTVMLEMYRFLTGDGSALSSEVSKEVNARLRLALDMKDPDLVFDLRHLNEGHKTKFDAFWSAASRYIEEESMKAVQSRRHGQVCYSTLAISARDFIDRVKEKLPEDAVIPSEDWVRFQFEPANPWSRSAERYSGRLAIKNMIEKRQLSHDHQDQHYAACLFRYLREAAILHRDISTLVFLDDKHHIKVGEPGYPVAAVERGKSDLVGKDVALSVGDYDFTKFKLIPSVSLICEVPSSIEESFYRGQITVSIKDATFEPSTPLRHATELKSNLRALSVNTIRHPVLLLYSNGGPDHNVTFGSVKISLIALFRSMNLDYLLAMRTCPGHSFRNPVERCMSILNLGLQAVGMMRTPCEEAVEKGLGGVNNTADVRKLEGKFPDIRESVASSLASTKETVENVLSGVQLHKTPVRTMPAAAPADIDVVCRRESPAHRHHPSPAEGPC